MTEAPAALDGDDAPTDGALKGLGSVSLALLAEEGFKTRDDLEAVGSKMLSD